MAEKSSFDDGCCGPSVLSQLASTSSSSVRGPSGFSRRVVQVPVDSSPSTIKNIGENEFVDEFMTTTPLQSRTLASEFFVSASVI